MDGIEACLILERKHPSFAIPYPVGMGTKSTTLSDRIRERREQLDIGKAELARKVGVSPTAVGLWESGDTKNLRMENLFALADELDISARELAIGKPELPRDVRDDEREMIEKYRKASPRWRLSLRLLAGIPDEMQDAASDRINTVLAELSANPPPPARGALESDRERLFHKGSSEITTTRQKRRSTG